jgi:predicted nucleic acid-binding protein
MSVILDTNMLVLFLKPSIPPPSDPATKQPVSKAAERVKFLIEQLAKNQTRILIPATVWAEFLVVLVTAEPLSRHS